MESTGKAFVKGGVGCFAIFLFLAMLALISGGTVRIDFGGAIILLLIGGALGLLVNWVYQKGKRDVEESEEENEED